MDPKDRQSITYYAIRAMAIVIVAILCGVQSAGVIGSVI